MKEKLGDVLNRLFEVKTTVPEIEQMLYEDQCQERRKQSNNMLKLCKFKKGREESRER